MGSRDRLYWPNEWGAAANRKAASKPTPKMSLVFMDFRDDTEVLFNDADWVEPWLFFKISGLRRACFSRPRPVCLDRGVPMNARVSAESRHSFLLFRTGRSVMLGAVVIVHA